MSEARPEARLGRPWLIAARVAWIAVALTVMGLAAAGFVVGLRDWTLIGSKSIYSAITAVGISVTAATWIGLVVPHVAFAAIGIVIFIRRNDDWPAMLFAIGLIALTTLRPLVALERAVPALRAPIEMVWLFEIYLLLITPFIFPDGRFVPSRTRLLAVVAAPAAWFLSAPTRTIIMLPDQPAGGMTGRFVVAVTVISAYVALGLAAQLHRYRNASTPTERQQVKIVGLSVNMLVAIMAVTIALPSLFFDTGNRWFAWTMLATVPLFIGVAVFVAVAILRYNLFSIDRIISRTVAYATLSLLLVAVYISTTVVLGLLLGGRSDLSVAGATLAVAAAFRTARRRIQDAVDRRFNRRKYDIARTVERFGSRLKNEFDVDELELQLLRVVASTIEPRTASLWHAANQDAT